MKRLPTVLLHHETPLGNHYDWLWPHPSEKFNASLWAARTVVASSDWAKVRVWTLWRIPPHRRCYLTYQGAVAPKAGQQRGHVHQVDKGWLIPRIWTDDRIVVEVSMRRFRSLVQIYHLGQDRFRATAMRVS